MYPPLPTIEPKRPDEPIAYYGSRIVTFLLRTTVTATLSDDDLELADYAIGHALSGRITIGDTTTPIAVYDRLEDMRRMVAIAVRARKTEQPTDVTQGPETVPTKDGSSTVLRPIAPIRRPPSGAMATVDISF